MTENRKIAGKCLCGAVKVHAEASSPDVAVCHCSMCRRWSAGPFMEITCEKVSFEGEENIGRVSSSDWAERGFCKQCGSNLFYHIVGAGDYQISIGLLDDQSKLHLSLQVFIDDKPPFYEFANETKTMTGAEVVAAFAPPPE